MKTKEPKHLSSGSSACTRVCGWDIIRLPERIMRRSIPKDSPSSTPSYSFLAIRLMRVVMANKAWKAARSCDIRISQHTRSRPTRSNGDRNSIVVEGRTLSVHSRTSKPSSAFVPTTWSLIGLQIIVIPGMHDWPLIGLCIFSQECREMNPIRLTMQGVRDGYL